MSTNPSRRQHPASRRSRRPLAALSAIGASLALAACGSSSSSSSSTSASSTSAAKSSAPSPKGTTGSGPGRGFAALSTCLKKQGITLGSVPAGGSTGGSGAPGAGGAAPGVGGGGSLKLPNGVTRAQLQAALKKCGGGNFTGPRAGFNSATARTALVKYAACLRQNGIDVPSPNTSGNGPVFNTKGINTNSTAFKSAESKCSSDLPAGFARGGAGGGGAGGGPPVGGAGGAPPGGESEPNTPAFKASEG